MTHSNHLEDVKRFYEILDELVIRLYQFSLMRPGSIQVAAECSA